MDSRPSQTAFRRFEQICTAAGLKVTQQRLEIYQQLLRAKDHPAAEALTTPHHHFLCDRCGQVIDFCWPNFDALQLPPPPDGAGLVARTSVIMHGQCAACLQAEAEGRQD